LQDTPADILQKQREIIHAKSPDERFMIGVAAINFGRMMVESSIKQSKPDITEIDLKIETFKRYYSTTIDSEELQTILLGLKSYWEKNLQTNQKA